MAAKRYSADAHWTTDQRGDKITLVLLHGLGQHKEQWEPIVGRLFDSAAGPHIQEAWSFDWQSHGESAVLNVDSDALRRGPESITVADWADALIDFIKSDAVAGHRRFIGVGYSSGVLALITAFIHLPPSLSSSLIFVEPTLLDADIWAEHPEINETFELSTKGTTFRKNVWKNRQEAYAYIKQRPPWKGFDDAVLRLYVEHGMHRSPIDGTVTRSCPTAHEARGFQVNSPYVVEGAIRLAEVSQRLPVHAIFGEHKSSLTPSRSGLCDGYVPRSKDSIADRRSRRRTLGDARETLGRCGCYG
uniref:AB hydrolase-1 domain-containing protein n=1 Tax=Mycena chlorophos TaxID=658473 RepID=A0ABQ0LN62_MYCCL|nr:predicted protein [Mycena chlorophos]